MCNVRSISSEMSLSTRGAGALSRAMLIQCGEQNSILKYSRSPRSAVSHGILSGPAAAATSRAGSSVSSDLEYDLLDVSIDGGGVCGGGSSLSSPKRTRSEMRSEMRWDVRNTGTSRKQ